MLRRAVFVFLMIAISTGAQQRRRVSLPPPSVETSLAFLLRLRLPRAQRDEPRARHRSRGRHLLHDAFSDKSGGIVLYIGDMFGLNNVRRAYSRDNGLVLSAPRSSLHPAQP